MPSVATNTIDLQYMGITIELVERIIQVLAETGEVHVINGPIYKHSSGLLMEFGAILAERAKKHA